MPLDELTDLQEDETARDRCLRTPELLEAILLHTNSQDILLAQRVSKCWQRTIKDSIWLQRMIFMKPVDCGTVSWLDWCFDEERMYTMLHLGESLRACRRTDELKYVPHWGQTRLDRKKFRIFVNPILAKRFPIICAGSVKAGPVYAVGDGMNHPYASWKKMLITQPPINTMFLRWKHEYDGVRLYRSKGWSLVPMTCLPGSHGITALDLMDSMPRDTSGFVWIEASERWCKFQGLESLHGVVKEKYKEVSL